MRSADHTSLATPVVTALIGIGAAATALGGLGVGFRAAGLGYLGQSVALLVVGVALLAGSLRRVERLRRAAMVPCEPVVPLRGLRTPAHVRAIRFAPAHQEGPAGPPERIRVHAWIAEPLALPPAAA